VFLFQENAAYLSYPWRFKEFPMGSGTLKVDRRGYYRVSSETGWSQKNNVAYSVGTRQET